MKITDIIQEKYEKDHTCLTPDTIFKINIHNDSISIKLDLPMDLELSEEDATDLESDIHYALEKVLAKFF